MLRRKDFVGKRQFRRRVAFNVKQALKHSENNENKNTQSEVSESDLNESLPNTVNVAHIGGECTHSASNSVSSIAVCQPTNLSLIINPIFNNDNEISQNVNLPDSETDTEDDGLCLTKKLISWACGKHNVSHSAVTDLLHILKPYHPELPLDSRTLFRTPNKIFEKELDTGKYCHIGIKNALNNLLPKICVPSREQKILEISFNIDGLPLFHSNNVQFWPILGLVKTVKSTPFVVGIFCGKSKPKPLGAFLEDFINELLDLMKTGYIFNDECFLIKVHSIVCDAPARAFVKCVKSHMGYASCDKCVEYGEYHGRIVFRDTNANLRTDQSFKLQLDEEHHNGVSPFTKLDIDMISCFPIDYMHAVCLGVTKKLLNTWVGGPLNVRLSHNIVSQISLQLENFKLYMPVEFSRKPRSVSELPRWKATEFRTFLIYLGPVVLKNSIDIAVYEHFLLLHTAISILLSNHHLSNLGSDLAGNLLDIFVKHSKKIYGIEFMAYNVHILCHLHLDVKHLGHLDNFSSFPFENFLGEIKRLIRSPVNPLSQIFRRLTEKTLADVNVIAAENIPNLLWEHSVGPILQKISVSKQFKKLEYLHLVFCVNSYSPANSYFFTNDKKVIQLENIVVDSQNVTVLIGKQFMLYESYYKYPFDSANLGIYILRNLSITLETWYINDILTKCLLIPDSGNMVCFPLVHSWA